VKESPWQLPDSAKVAEEIAARLNEQADQEEQDRWSP